MALRVDFHDIKRALNSGSITPIEALHKWTTWALKQRTLELKPYFEYVRDTLPEVTWHQPGDELLVHGYLPVTWTCPTDFYEWADDFMGKVFTMGAHLRRYIAEKDPEHASELLEAAICDIDEKRKAETDKARRQADPEDPEFVKRGNPTGANQHRSGNDLNAINSKPRKHHPGDKPGTLRRLARTRPDLLERYEAGELSANAAAVEAGFRRFGRWVPLDSPDNYIRAGLRVFTVTELAQALGRASEG